MGNDLKETKELLVLLVRIATLLAVEFKDGAQAKDFSVVVAKIAENPDLKTMFISAYNGIDKVQDEVKTITLSEGFHLLTTIAPEIVSLIGAIKK